METRGITEKEMKRALEIAKAIFEAPSRSQAKRLNVMHEVTLAAAFLELHEKLKVAEEKLDRHVRLHNDESCKAHYNCIAEVSEALAKIRGEK